MTAPLFFVDPDAPHDDVVVIEGAEGRHAADVRRIDVGEPVSVADGIGGVVHGRVAEVGRGRVVVAVDERSEHPEPAPRFVVVQALAKGGRDLDAVEAMTETGVDEVVAWEAERSVARATDRTAAKWSATAREAAKQSRRPRIPVVVGPVRASAVVERVRSAALAVVLHESATEALAELRLPVNGEVVVVVGPEGGLTPREVDEFTAAGACVCRLGDTVLRTSTAGVAALSVLSAQARWR